MTKAKKRKPMWQIADEAIHKPKLDLKHKPERAHAIKAKILKKPKKATVKRAKVAEAKGILLGDS